MLSRCARDVRKFRFVIIQCVLCISPPAFGHAVIVFCVCFRYL